MALTQQEKQELMTEYQIHETDTGSAESASSYAH